MYPTLSHFFKQEFGWDIPLPVQTYGFLVALAFLTGIWMFSIEMKRKEREKLLQPVKKKIKVGEPAKPKDLIISGIIGFIIGFKLLDAVLRYSAFVDNPQDFILSFEGSFMGGILGAAASIFLTWREKNKQKLDKPRWEEKTIRPHQLSGNILVVAGISGLIGAKIFHNLENIDQLIADPIDAIFSFSGLTFLGGVIVGTFAVLWYIRRFNLPAIHLFDVAALALPIAYAVGRLGCQFSGDGCWGIPNPDPQPDWLAWLPDWLWAFDYPHNVIGEGVHIHSCTGKYCTVLDTPVYPTPLYESIMSAIIFGILFSVRKLVKVPGMLFSFYLILGGFERFFIEKIRVNTKYHIFGYDITQAEILSSLMVIGGIAVALILWKKREYLKTKFGPITKPSETTV